MTHFVSSTPFYGSATRAWIALYAALIAIHVAAAAWIFAVAMAARLRRALTLAAFRRDDGSLSRRQVLRLADAIGNAWADTAEGGRIPVPPQSWASAQTHAIRCLEQNLKRGTLPSHRTTRRVAGCLAIVARQRREENLHLLLSALWQASPEIRTVAAQAIRQSADDLPAAAVPLSMALREGRGVGTYTVAAALRAVLVRHQDLIAPLAADPSPRIRRIAVACAGALTADASQRPAASQLPSALLAIAPSALSDDDGTVRAEACRWLYADHASFNRLCDMLGDPHEPVRVAAARSLARGGAPGGLAAVARALPFAKPHTLRDTLNAIAAEDAPPAPELLQDLARVGTAASLALACLSVAAPDRATVESLLRLVMDDSLDLNLRRGAARALALLARHPDAVFRQTAAAARLSAVLDSEIDDEILASAVDAIAVAGTGEEAAALVARIGTAGRFLREKIVEGLAINAFVTRQKRSPAARTVLVPRGETGRP